MGRGVRSCSRLWLRHLELLLHFENTGSKSPVRRTYQGFKVPEPLDVLLLMSVQPLVDVEDALGGKANLVMNVFNDNMDLSELLPKLLKFLAKAPVHSVGALFHGIEALFQTLLHSCKVGEEILIYSLSCSQFPPLYNRSRCRQEGGS